MWRIEEGRTALDFDGDELERLIAGSNIMFEMA